MPADPFNPAGPQTPAGNTMSYPRGQSGGRTRNVINIVNPGSEGTKAYSLQATNSAPTTATDGFPNFRSQRYLHIVAKNTDTGGQCKFTLYGYHSFSGVWGKLLNTQGTNDISGAYEVTLAENDTVYAIVPIDGIERIAIHCTVHSGNTGTGEQLDVWLGTNSF